MADMSPDDASRAKNFGQIGAIGGLSFIVAMVFGGVFSDPELSRHFNPSLPFWITALLSYANLIVMIYLFQETHEPSPHPGLNPLKGMNNLMTGLKSPELRIIYAINFLFMLSWVGTMQFFPSFLLQNFQFGLGPTTLTLMFVGVVWSITNLIINPLLAKRFFSGYTLLVCLFGLAFCLLFTLFFQKETLFFTFFFPAVCFASLCWTNGLATISLKAPSAIQGSILGINQSMNSIAAMVSPAIGGVIVGISKHGFFIFSGFVAAAAFLILLQSRAYRHHTYD
ncbi:MAG: MFS transporter [Candidatus Melainabacteria bacterium]|nr:MFS transporter [Candidatus Melainabacteria bacterium]